MAFSIFAETDKKLDFEEVHNEIYSDDLNFEYVPMPGLGINGGDAMGICIPLRNANNDTWMQLKPVLKKLHLQFGCDVYDLYGGQKLGLMNIDTFRRNLLSE